ncbi:MAG: transketolase family protein, partial [Bacteroidetes bacterium]|nr:transketolase family protein [Bacteroidota bacterium]
KVAKKCGAIVTAEEHQVIGGMGSAIAELLSKECPTPINFVGMQDKFGESGEPNELLDKYKLNAAGIVEAALEVMKMKK